MISVIVPVYNTAKYLGNCLESILTQDFSDIEVLIIDDGSPEDIYQVVSEYLSRYSFIQYLKIPHSGPGRARNIGIQKASGEFIAFVDSDDTLLPGYLSKLHEGIISTDLSICGIQKFSIDHQDISGEICQGLLSSNEVLSYLLQKKFDLSSPCNKLYRTSIIRENSISFPEGMFYEDILFNIKYLCAIKKCYAVGERLYCYQKREKSITTAPSLKNIIDYYVIANSVSNLVNPLLQQPALNIFLTNIGYKMQELISEIKSATSEDVFTFLKTLSNTLLEKGGM